MHSPKFEKTKKFYELGLGDKEWLSKAVAAGAITEAEKAEIMGVSLPLEV